MPNLREIDLRVILKKCYPIVFLLIVFAVCVDLLGMVWKITEPLIAGGERDAIVEQLEKTFPAEEGNEWAEVKVGPEDDAYSYYVVVNGDNIINFSFMGAGAGRNGDIRVLISFGYEVPLGEEFDAQVVADEATIDMIFATKQIETPGIGDKAFEIEFTDTFIDRIVDEVAYAPDGDMDIITGATVSTKALIDIVREEARPRLEALPSAQDIETAVIAMRAAAAGATE